MTERKFDNTDDLKKVGTAIKQWLDEKRLASLFELPKFGESHVWNDAIGHVSDLACLMEPNLKKNDKLFSKAVHSKIISFEQESQITGAVCDAAEAYFALGLIIGADIAEPTGKVSDRLISGWIHARLADPFAAIQHTGERRQAKRPKATGRIS